MAEMEKKMTVWPSLDLLLLWVAVVVQLERLLSYLELKKVELLVPRGLE